MNVIPLCLLLFSCTTTGNIDWRERQCMVAGIHTDCRNVPQIEDDEKTDEENYTFLDRRTSRKVDA